MFRTLLVAVDGSPHALRAVEAAAELATRFEAERVDLVHVVIDPAMTFSSEASVWDWKRLQEQLEAEGEQVLARAEEVLRKTWQGTTVHKLLKGSIADSIVRYAEKEGADLLLVGRRGLNALERFFLGSVSGRLAHRSPCSVLIVGDQKEGESASA